MAFRAQEFHDLVRLLDQHPEWRAEMRRLLLTDDVLSLPQAIRDLTRTVEALADAQRRTEERVEALVDAQRRTEERVEALVDAQRRTEERVEALVDAQRRTEERVETLADAQRRTEERVEALADAQRRTEERVEALADAQRRTEERVETLADAQRRTEQRLDALTETVAALADAQRRTEQRLDALTETVAALVDAQRRTEQRLDALAQDVTALAKAQRETEIKLQSLTTQMEEMAKRLDVFGRQLGDLKGIELEHKYEKHASSFFHPIARRIRVVSSQELANLVEDAAEEGRLTWPDAHDILSADLVLNGRRQEDLAQVYIVVEVSWGIGVDDVKRAEERARKLSQLGMPAIPVVAGRFIIPDASDVARELNVWKVLDGRAIPPTEPTWRD